MSPLFQRTVILGLSFIPVLVAAGCGHRLDGHDSGPPEHAAAASSPVSSNARLVQVTIDNFTFKPAQLTVPVGATVTWTNRDDVPHTVASTEKPRLLNSPTLDTDESFTHVFTAPGTYEYYCTVHPKMTGRIIVR